MKPHCLDIECDRSSAAHRAAQGHSERKNSSSGFDLTVVVQVCIIGCLSLAGCRERGDRSQASTEAGSVTISAAASTQDAVNEVAKLFEQRTGDTVLVNTASSSALANQIISGAPAALFLSANVRWADTVEQRIPTAARRLLLNNKLVMIVPRGNPQNVTSPQDLMEDKVARIALAGEKVPAGMYARQALETLGINDAIQKEQKIVTGHNVRIALSYVDRAEADAGIVYATDAQLSDGVETVYTFDAATHDPIEYPLLLLTRREDNDVASRLFDFLGSSEAAAIFERYGFKVAGSDR